MKTEVFKTDYVTVLDTSKRACTIVPRGGSRNFLRGGALVSCSTSTPINHIAFCFFFLQNTSYIRKPQVISGGRGCAPPETRIFLPRSRSVKTSEKGGRAVEKQTSEKRREKRRGELVSTFSNTSIHPLSRPLPEKPFIVSK